MLERNLTKVVYAAAANLNQAENTVLLTFIAAKPITIHRFGVRALAAEGLLAPMRLKLRRTPKATGTAADITGEVLNPGGAQARGVGVYKTASDRIDVAAGDTITITSSVAAGGTSTGLVWLEYGELPYAGTLIEGDVASA